MNTPRQLFALGMIAAVLLCIAMPARAVRPYNSKVSANQYKRYSQTSRLNYQMPIGKSLTPKRPLLYSSYRQTLTPGASWTGLRASDRRTNGDVSPYGSRLLGHRNYPDNRFGKSLAGRLITARTPYSVR